MSLSFIYSTGFLYCNSVSWNECDNFLTELRPLCQLVKVSFRGVFDKRSHDVASHRYPQFSSNAITATAKRGFYTLINSRRKICASCSKNAREGAGKGGACTSFYKAQWLPFARYDIIVSCTGAYNRNYDAGKEAFIEFRGNVVALS